MEDRSAAARCRRDVLDALTQAKTGLSFERLATVILADDDEGRAAVAALRAEHPVREEPWYDGSSTTPRTRYRLTVPSLGAA